MDFSLSDEQRMLKDTLERFISEDYTFEHRRAWMQSDVGFSREIWLKLSELGLLGLLVPEADGGFGGGGVEQMLLMQAVGRGLVLEPVFASAVLAAAVLRRAASAEQKARWLPGLLAGERLFTLAYDEREARGEPAWIAARARREGAGFVLDGCKTAVPHGDNADHIIVAARIEGEPGARDGLGLFCIERGASGLTVRGYPTVDGLRAADLTLDGVRVADGDVIASPGAAGEALDYAVDCALAALAAEAVGAMEALLEMTLDYLKTRKQFGVPIGQFQALQHRAVDMRASLEQARSLSILAANRLEDEPAERARACAAAKVMAGRSARHVGQEAIQLHGGIGMTLEYAAGHYFKRLTVIDHSLGGADCHLERFADLATREDAA